MPKFMHLMMILMLLLSSGCSWSVDTELAELAVEDFHKSYNKASFKTIYINASPEFRDYVKQSKFERLLKKLHHGLGQHENSTLISWSAKSTIRDGTIITLIYQAAYEYDDKAKESFSFKVNDGLAQLYNFNVSSGMMHKKKPPRATDI